MSQIKTIEETLFLIGDLNERAHDDAWEYWIDADNEES